MKRLEKDFIIAWILGMLLPTVILLVAVKLDDRQVSTASRTTEPTASEILSFSSGINIPVLMDNGLVENMELES